MADYKEPATALADVYAKVAAGSWYVRHEAQIDALALGSAVNVRLCLLALTEHDFHKAMDADEPKWAGAIQDVYKPVFGGMPLYVKFQIWPLKKNLLYVISFKEQ